MLVITRGYSPLTQPCFFEGEVELLSDSSSLAVLPISVNSSALGSWTCFLCKCHGNSPVVTPHNLDSQVLWWTWVSMMLWICTLARGWSNDSSVYPGKGSPTREAKENSDRRAPTAKIWSSNDHISHHDTSRHHPPSIVHDPKFPKTLPPTSSAPKPSKTIQNHPKSSKIIQNHPKSSKTYARGSLYPSAFSSPTWSCVAAPSPASRCRGSRGSSAARATRRGRSAAAPPPPAAWAAPPWAPGTAWGSEASASRPCCGWWGWPLWRWRLGKY